MNVSYLALRDDLEKNHYCFDTGTTAIHLTRPDGTTMSIHRTHNDELDMRRAVMIAYRHMNELPEAAPIGNAQEVMGRLALARRNLGLTQRQACDLLGINAKTTLSQYETPNHIAEPRLSTVLDMCRIYGVSVVWAMTGHEPTTDEMTFDMIVQQADVTISEMNSLKSLISKLSEPSQTIEPPERFIFHWETEPPYYPAFTGKEWQIVNRKNLMVWSQNGWHRTQYTPYKTKEDALEVIDTLLEQERDEQ